MDIESVGPYSPSTIYGEFTSPFKYQKHKPVTINAHTPYDKLDATKNDEEKVYSRNYFKGKPRAKISYKNLYEENFNKSKETNNNKNNIIDRKDLNPNNQNNKIKKEQIDNKKDIMSFSYSKMDSGSNKILNDAISKKGYSTDELIVMKKAFDSYKKSSYITKNPVESISTCAYEVF